MPVDSRHYELADLVTREILPLFLEHEDGRGNFPADADLIRHLQPITSRHTALGAAEILRGCQNRINRYRDGAMAPILKQAFWLCVVAAAIEDEYASVGSYGALGVLDLAAGLGVEIPTETVARLKELAG